MQKQIHRFFFFALSLCAVISGVAAESPQPVTLGPTPSIGGAIFRMIGALALVVAIFLGAAWLFRNLHRFQQPGAATRKLQVLEARSLGACQAVYVVAYEQQRLLIGSTAQGLTLLTHLPDGAVQTEAGRTAPVPFGEALMQALGRK